MADHNDLPTDAQKLCTAWSTSGDVDQGDVDQARRLLATFPGVNLNTIKWSEQDEGEAEDEGEGELTLLAHAARKGHAEICQMLLDRGADVNQRSDGMVLEWGFSTSQGTSPLINACRNGHSKVVNVLLAVDGIDVNCHKDDEATALFITSLNGQLKVVEMLLAVDGIQVNQANNNEIRVNWRFHTASNNP